MDGQCGLFIDPDGDLALGVPVYLRPCSDQRLALRIDLRPAGECAVDFLALHREKLEGMEVKFSARQALGLPLPPCLAEIQAGAEAEFADPEDAVLPGDRLPARRQAVAAEKDMAAFQPTVFAAIKVIAKFLRIGHIAVMPVEGLGVAGCGVTALPHWALLMCVFGIVVAHDRSG